MVKLISVSLAISLVLYVCFYLPKQVKRGRGNRFRYIVFSVMAFLVAFWLLRTF